jgi:flagellin-specific chaperone FliS
MFLYEKTTLANMHKSVDEVDAALRIVDKLLEGWHDLQKHTNEGQPAPAPEPEQKSLSINA